MGCYSNHCYIELLKKSSKLTDRANNAGAAHSAGRAKLRQGLEAGARHVSRRIRHIQATEVRISRQPPACRILLSA